MLCWRPNRARANKRRGGTLCRELRGGPRLGRARDRGRQARWPIGDAPEAPAPPPPDTLGRVANARLVGSTAAAATELRSEAKRERVGRTGRANGGPCSSRAISSSQGLRLVSTCAILGMNTSRRRGDVGDHQTARSTGDERRSGVDLAAIGMMDGGSGPRRWWWSGGCDAATVRAARLRGGRRTRSRAAANRRSARKGGDHPLKDAQSCTRSMRLAGWGPFQVPASPQSSGREPPTRAPQPSWRSARVQSKGEGPRYGFTGERFLLV